MRWLIYGVVLVLIVAVALLALGVYISPKDKLSKSEAIVAVSGGDTRARTMEAVRLYKGKWAPHIIFSGAALDPRSESNAAAMREIAMEAGVSPESITIEEGADNTRENASRVASQIQALEYNSIILVTSPYHQRRTYIEFKKELGDSEVEIVNHPAPDQRWSRRSWWRSPFGWYITVSETPKVIYALTQD